jgi:HEAT repeat protein
MVSLTAAQGTAVGLEGLTFIRELAHGDRQARSAATYVLARLHLDQGLDLLLELLNDPELSIRCQAAEALGRTGSSRVILNLIQALAGPPELRHVARRSLAAIIQKSGEQSARELGNTAISSDRVEIRSELADVLGRLPQGSGEINAAVLETLISLLKDPEWRVRWKVVKSLERLARSPQATPLPESARTALFSYAR